MVRDTKQEGQMEKMGKGVRTIITMLATSLILRKENSLLETKPWIIRRYNRERTTTTTLTQPVEIAARTTWTNVVKGL